MVAHALRPRTRRPMRLSWAHGDRRPCVPAITGHQELEALRVGDHPVDDDTLQRCRETAHPTPRPARVDSLREPQALRITAGRETEGPTDVRRNKGDRLWTENVGPQSHTRSRWGRRRRRGERGGWCRSRWRRGGLWRWRSRRLTGGQQENYGNAAASKCSNHESRTRGRSPSSDAPLPRCEANSERGCRHLETTAWHFLCRDRLVTIHARGAAMLRS
jgi:hypothetical protein